MGKKHIFLLIGIIGFVIGMIASSNSSHPELWKAITLGGVIIFFWLVEALPIYVTAMLPLVFAIPLGLLKPDQLAAAYAHKFVFLFLGGFMLALAMEKWDVHKQIAIGIIRFTGTSKIRLLLGFIISTGFLSMWISNTATTLMMLPMAMAVVSNLSKSTQSKFPLFLLLSIAYAASIGGMATLIGSPPNSVMAGVLWDNYQIEIDFIGWMKYGMPLSILMMAILFVYFVVRLRGDKEVENIQFDIEKKPWNSDQKKVIGVFIVVVALWSLRTLIKEWTDFSYSDENVAILAAIVLFVLPSSSSTKSLLEWKDTSKLSWGILILFGGGLALAKMLAVNGVLDQIVLFFDQLNGTSIVLILLVIVAISIFGTEIMSNTALVSVFIPIIAQFAVKADIPVTQLCFPVALAASCAFMLPVGTPPNAIVFSSGKMTIAQMARNGLILNLIGVALVVLFSILFIA